ncbi:hypothetical protein L7F22_017679 [Adiantum nelumboides]|nr:hypothetical protein [Adiantum nelumboides]
MPGVPDFCFLATAKVLFLPSSSAGDASQALHSKALHGQASPSFSALALLLEEASQRKELQEEQEKLERMKILVKRNALPKLSFALRSNDYQLCHFNGVLFRLLLSLKMLLPLQ